MQNFYNSYRSAKSTGSRWPRTNYLTSCPPRGRCGPTRTFRRSGDLGRRVHRSQESRTRRKLPPSAPPSPPRGGSGKRPPPGTPTRDLNRKSLRPRDTNKHPRFGRGRPPWGLKRCPNDNRLPTRGRARYCHPHPHREDDFGGGGPRPWPNLDRRTDPNRSPGTHRRGTPRTGTVPNQTAMGSPGPRVSRVPGGLTERNKNPYDRRKHW